MRTADRILGARAPSRACRGSPRSASADQLEPQGPGGARGRVEGVGAANAVIAPGPARDRACAADRTVERLRTALGLDLPAGQVEGARALGAAIRQVAGKCDARDLRRAEGLALPSQVVFFEDHVAR